MIVKTTKVNLNVRYGPGTDFELIETLPKGTNVEVVDLTGWTPIRADDGSVVFVASRYLEDAKPAQPAAGDPSWITWAKSKLGVHEFPGAEDNPEIVPWYSLTTLPKSYWRDATAWCAVFINAALMKSGIKTNKSARAFDWLDWGKKVNTPQVGDVVIFSFSHVAFYLSGFGTGYIKVIGGNQSDAVTITTFDEETVSGYRRPV